MSPHYSLLVVVLAVSLCNFEIQAFQIHGQTLQAAKHARVDVEHNWVGRDLAGIGHRSEGDRKSRIAPLSSDLGSLSSWGRTASPHEGIVHFLFMVDHDLSHIGLWEQFFSRAPAGTWQGWLHCTNAEGCRHSRVAERLGLVRVQTVPTSYCRDLVTATVQLIRAALASSAGAPAPGGAEKFVLIGDTTLPVKPFSMVHRVLTAYNESDVCITPASEWQWSLIDAVNVSLVKHSQWVVLNRADATTLVREWDPPRTSYDDHGWWIVPVRQGSKRSNQRKVRAIRFYRGLDQWSCADEHAVFAKIFGTLEGSRTGEQDVSGIGRVALTGSRALNPQGRCHTFVLFHDRSQLGNLTVAIERHMERDMMMTQMPASIDMSHPLSLDLARHGTLAALRRSDFLFARKFSSKHDNSDTDHADAFHMLVDEDEAFAAKI